jgi:hypothetical protein
LPKKALWFIAAGIAGMLYVVWDAGRLPARVTVMNQSATAVQDAVLVTSAGPVQIGTLRSGESRALSVEPTDHLVFTYTWRGERKEWRSIEPLDAGQPLALYVTSNGRISPRSRLGTIER